MKFICLIVSFIVGFSLTIGIRLANGPRLANGSTFGSKNPIPVALSESGESKLNPDSRDLSPHQLNLHWGGFYAYKKGSSFRILRLLDLNARAYHVMDYKETFDRLPGMSQISFLIPDDEHTTGSSLDFLSLKPIYIGGKKLSGGDLLEFNQYFNSIGMREDKVAIVTSQVMNLSGEDAFETMLSEKDGGLVFDQASF